MISATHTASLAPTTTSRADRRERLAAGRLTMPLLLVAATAPFERAIAPVFGGFTLTTVEAAVLVTLASAAIAQLRTRGSLGFSISQMSPLAFVTLAWLAVLAISALLAPAFHGNALRFIARVCVAAALCLATAALIDSRARARTLVAIVLATGIVVAIIAVLEVAQVASVLSALTLFRPGFHVVGGQLRASSTLQYPTIASMFLEIVFVLGLWLLLERKTYHRRPDAIDAILFVALATVAAGIIATFTRAGLIGMAVALGVVGGLHALRQRRLDRHHATLAALALVIVGLVLLSRSPELLLTRFRVEGSQQWYGARYDAPASLHLTTASEYQIPIALANTGQIAWDSMREPRFAMSYHWLRADNNAVIEFEGWRTKFEKPVVPGARTLLPVNVRTPAQPGRYVLVWDVVHEGRAWLSTEGIAPARTIVEVTGPARGELTTKMARLPGTPTRPDRWTLWQVALRMVADRPLLGVGPDNYRLAYGRYAGVAEWDNRVHANNMYLDVLAGAGIAGLVALLSLVAMVGWRAWRLWKHASSDTAIGAAVLCAAWLVIAGHALVDSFLAFTTTYVMFALVAGLISSAPMDSHAHRI